MTSAEDSCAAHSLDGNNRRCLSSHHCGCETAADCDPGFVCRGPTGEGLCEPCLAARMCGTTCENCRTLSNTLTNRQYYVCAQNTAPLATACVVTECVNASANCDGDDVDGCELDTSADPVNCGDCGVACASSPNHVCANSQCE